MPDELIEALIDKLKAIKIQETTIIAQLEAAYNGYKTAELVGN